MPELKLRPSRRSFMAGAAATAAAGLLGVVPDAANEAITAPRRKGRIDDIEHVVILMQENRSVDHYYGTMRGVRGFGDKAALKDGTGRSVFHQPDAGRPDGGYLLPFHVDTSKVDGQDLGGNDHSWGGVHRQWADGRNDGWISDTGENTMSYFTDADLPFNRALARAFTFCDQYFCSIKGPTCPNRLFHWSGTIDPHGLAGGPAYFNLDDYNPVCHWTTYPERLQSAGISWQVYANDEVGDGGGEDGFVGDYGDNPLWLFQAYHDALASSDPRVRQLADRASVKAFWQPNSGRGHNVDHVLAQFVADADGGALPAVSWVVAPHAYSEHPAARPIDGAAYTQTMLNAVWSNPKLSNNTVVLINYDEHDGFFDHVVPPTAPVGTADEFVLGLPVGLGPRVPMTVISPWSRGGWINSQVFDHTSVLRFLELWTGVTEPNISAWRRAICGDLTSAFDFHQHDTTVPLLPDTAALRRKADETQSKLPPPSAPAPGEQSLPVPESGVAPARPLPYQAMANVTVGTGALTVSLSNSGSQAVQLQVYDHGAATLPSQRIDVAATSHETAIVPAVDAYNIAVHGPNGFLREATGSETTHGVEVTVTVAGSDRHPELALTLTKSTPGTVMATIDGLGGASPRRVALSHGVRSIGVDPLALHHGWYDLSVTLDSHSEYLRRFAGHLENGRSSVTG
jgi:phospholipase C